MKKVFSEEHVFPRPTDTLPEYANLTSRRCLSEKLVEAFQLSEGAAAAISNAVVDPSAVRKSIGEPTEPRVEEIAVPGGILLGIRATVWVRKVTPDPRNPRLGPSRRHPFAVEPGSGGEDAKFRPVPEPKSPDGVSPEVAELVVDIESRHHFTWGTQQAAKYVIAENDWRDSIASQGVMEAVWLAATTYRHVDGSASVTTLTTVEGSSRVTAVHDLLSISSADVPYEDNDAKLRAHLRKVNEAQNRGPTANEATALRCEMIPALIIVGFKKHPVATTSFPTAVKSLVALRHVDPPKPWGAGPENESLADEVLDELQRRGLISQTQRDYYAGACTRAEAKAAHLSDDPAIRASAIVSLITSDDPRITEAIRVAVTSQSTRKRISPKLSNELATALILRAIVEDPARTDQVRRYLRHGFGKAVHTESWEGTDRNTDLLVNEALSEVRQALSAEQVTETGPASLELAVRAAYPLIVSGRLSGDRGTQNNAQPDRRAPGEVLDAMRQTVQGVQQLAQALRDFVEDRVIRAVDENGDIRKIEDGSADQPVSDVYLREEFPPPGKVRARRPGKTPHELLQNELAKFSDLMDQLKVVHAAIANVLTDDERPIVEANGVDTRLCRDWRQTLAGMSDDLHFWGRTFARKMGTPMSLVPVDDLGADEDDSRSVVEDSFSSSYGNWDHPDETEAGEVTA